MKKYLFICLLLIVVTPVLAAQDSVIVPIYRQLFHDKINDEQTQLDRLDGKMDGQIKVSAKPDINLVITDVMTRKIDELQNFVEQEARIKTNNEKIRYLSFIENLLKAFRVEWKKKEFNPVYVPILVKTKKKIMLEHIDGISMVAEIDNSPYQVGKLLTELFYENKGYEESRKILYKKFCALNPDKILQTIGPYINEAFADSLIVKSCLYNPTAIYSIAQAPESKLGALIHRNKNPIVTGVVELSKTPNALLYFPFLDSRRHCHHDSQLHHSTIDYIG
mgnify:CR=1 FL=1